MNAVVYHEYGPPNVLKMERVPEPMPAKHEVLVRVHAASLNSWDWDLLRGKPFLTRLGGLRKPKHSILGADIAGRVEAVGTNVTRFHRGDEVFGDISGSGWGGFAEYVCAHEKVLAPKSRRMTFEEAATLPQAGVLALQGLRHRGHIRPGHRVAINGAGGGVGMFAVQIAKSFGADVTGVDSKSKLNMLRSIGVDRVVDYAQQDFTRCGQCYDLILDVVARRPISDYRRALRPDGVAVIIGGAPATLLKAALAQSWISMADGKRVTLLMHRPNRDDLYLLRDYFETGRIVPVVDRRYWLYELPEALQYFGDGHARGKIVISV